MRASGRTPAAIAAALLAACAATAYAGKAIVSGHDADNHAINGTWFEVPPGSGNYVYEAGSMESARRFINKSVRYITGYDADPRFIRVLVVSHEHDPTGSGTGEADSVVGVVTALEDVRPGQLGLGKYRNEEPGSAFDLDIADNVDHPPGTVSISHGGYGYDMVSLTGPHAVDFNDYDVVVVGSNYGGWLTQDEVDGLVARSDDLIAFINSGPRKGLLALCETGHLDEMGDDHSRDIADPFAFVPVPEVVHIDHSQYELNYVILPDGEFKIGLVAEDVNGNYSHCKFLEPETWYVADVAEGDVDVPGEVDEDDDIITIFTDLRIGPEGPIEPGAGECSVFEGCDITLGAAKPHLWFQFDDGDRETFKFGNASRIEGNVGVAGGNRIDAHRSVIGKDLELDTFAGATAKLHRTQIDGLQLSLDLSAAELDAIAASDAAAAKTATRDLGGRFKLDRKDGAYTIASTGACNVVTVGDMDLKEVTLTLSGGADDVFIFNVLGKVKIERCTLSLVGVTPNHVLWNCPSGKGRDVQIKRSVWQGTWLLKDAKFELYRSQLTGAVFAGDDSKCRYSTVLCE